MQIRTMPALALASVAVGLALTACGPDLDKASSSAAPSSPSTSVSTSTAPADAVDGSPSAAPTNSQEETEKSCTERRNYAGDPRSDAEINSIGERTGSCPEPEKKATAAPVLTLTPIPAHPEKSCTERRNYAGDPRSDAEINSIGERTGSCPEPEKKTTPSGTVKRAGVDCTDQINYAGDPRPDAEINSIGASTGYCPPVKR